MAQHTSVKGVDKKERLTGIELGGYMTLLALLLLIEPPILVEVLHYQSYPALISGVGNIPLLGGVAVWVVSITLYVGFLGGGLLLVFLLFLVPFLGTMLSCTLGFLVQKTPYKWILWTIGALFLIAGIATTARLVL